MAESTRRPAAAAGSATRHASWLELFFDLVFVVAVSRLGVLLLDDPSPRGVLVFTGLLVTVWWLWISYSYFDDLFDTDRPAQRVAQLTAMLGAVVLAVTLGDGVGGDSGRYAITYGLLFLLLGAMYAVIGHTRPQHRTFCRWYVTGSLVGAVLWLLSVLVPEPWRYVGWGLAVVLNATICGPLVYAKARDVPRQRSHMPERFGLFTIVVLGEAVLAVVNGIDATGWNPAAVAIAVIGFVVASGIWWVYFAAFDEDAINRSLSAGRNAQVRSFLYGYGHLIVYGAIVAAGAGIELAAEEAAHPGHGDASLLVGGSQIALVAGFLVISQGIGLHGTPPVLTAKGGVVAVGLLVAVVHPPPLVATLLVGISWLAVVLVEQRVAGPVAPDTAAPEARRPAG
ncbi:low temperature requirement protein A [Micromonospora sp. URMC 105]|uniref:low temperature requirement protein A n=1 Tax=Micromonospora sp. URMC 105 TaxID=3423413 RepID=UPI003F1A7EBD